MDIVFNINHLGLEGLAATLTSLIRNCSNPAEVKFWFLCSDFKKNDKENINLLLASEKFSGGTEFIDFDAKKTFGSLRPLQGDWTAYGRLLIPEYIKSDYAMYLDADLVVSIDVLTLKNFDFKDNLIAAASSSSVKHILESSYFINELKWSPDTKSFNSGVLLFNIKKWNEQDINSLWKSLGEKYSKYFLTADQTLLNTICEGKFAELPLAFNTPWYPRSKKPENADAAIIHFVGSPKPWDYLGRFLHEGYDLWTKYNPDFWKRKYSRTTKVKIVRTYNIRRSIIRHLLGK